MEGKSFLSWPCPERGRPLFGQSLAHHAYTRQPLGMPISPATQPLDASVETPDIESSSDQYALRFAGPVGNYFLQTQARYVFELLQPWPAARVLDVGGGHAQLAGPLVEHGYDVTVVGSVEACGRRLAQRLPEDSYRFQACDLLNLPFAADSFDVVLAFRLLPHLNGWRTLLAELGRVAQKAVIVDYPDHRSFNALANHFFQAKKAIETDTRPFRCFHRREVLDEFARAGWGAPILRPQFFWPMALHRALQSRPLTSTAEAVARVTGLTRWFGSPVIMRVVSSHHPCC